MTDARDPQIRIGSLVQINPEVDHKYGGDFLVVTKILSFGVMGYLSMVYPRAVCGFEEVAYLRIRWEDVEYIGQVNWRIFRDWTGQNDDQNDDQSDRSE